MTGQGPLLVDAIVRWSGWAPRHVTLLLGTMLILCWLLIGMFDKKWRR